MTRAVVLLSGGLDSSTCAAIAAKEYGPSEVVAVTLYYGQKHAIELRAACNVAKELRLKDHIQLRLPDIFTGSALTDTDKEIPTASYLESLQVGAVPTYVPNRNMNFLAVATTLAMTMGADALYCGVHSEDAYNWAYSDTSPEFTGAMAAAIYISSYHKVRLVTPLQWMMKKDVVATAHALQVPVHLTYSCYRGGEVACGTCATCQSRLQAFKANGLIDPITYERLPSSDFWANCKPFADS